MKFEFGKYTEVTELAMKVNSQYNTDGYIRLFMCADVWDFWLCRVMENCNENYEREEGCYLLERNKIAMDRKGQPLTIKKATEILENDDFENWDIKSSYDLDYIIEMIDGGWGILNLSEPV